MEKQRGFPETVARKATDEDMDGSRATLRVLARSHVEFSIDLACQNKGLQDPR